MKFFHLADIHLGASPQMPKSAAIDRHAEIWQNFKSVLKKAKAEQVDFVLISGDLFHRQPLLRELKEVDYLFASISPVRVILTAGNHDYIHHDSRYCSFSWSKNVAMFEDESIQCLYFEQEETYIYGNSYRHVEIEAPLYDQLAPLDAPGVHILMAHGGDAKHIPMNYRQIATAGFDYVAMGHIHKPAMFDHGRMAYAGALTPIDINDVGAHGYISGEVIHGQIKTQFVPLEDREYKHLTIHVDSRMPWSMIMDRVSETVVISGKQHLYKIVLEGACDPDIEKDYDLMYTLGNILEIEDRTMMDIDIDALYEANRDNIIGLYIQRIRRIPADETIKAQALTLGIRALLQ